MAGTDPRAEKYLLALRCLNTSLELNASHPLVHAQVVEFMQLLSSPDGLPPKAVEVLKANFTAPSTDAKKLNENFLAEHKDSPRHVLSGTRASKLMGEDRAKCEKELVGLLQAKEITFEEAGEVLETLRAWRSTEAEGFKKAAAKKWPDVTAFA
jgi:N-alpha-acetyltransferase 15/16, NatA auxiliary subunit